MHDPSGLIHRLAWEARTPGLAPAGLVAAGAVAGALLRELARRASSAVVDLRVVAGGGLLMLHGAPEHLPWADGVRYCAPAPEASGLWLPTTAAPGLAADLVLGALERRAGQGAFLLWPDPELILPLDGARPVTPRLLDWLAAEFAQ